MPFEAYPAKRYRQNGVINEEKYINGPAEESPDWFDSPKAAKAAADAAEAAKVEAPKPSRHRKVFPE